MSEHTKRALITHVEIENFKAVKSAAIDLKPLTVVVGVNSSGKSTFIQAILLVVQHLRDEFSTELYYSLNEDLVQLGSFNEMALRTTSENADQIRVMLSFRPSNRMRENSDNKTSQIDWDVTLGPDESELSRFAKIKSLEIGRTRSEAAEPDDISVSTLEFLAEYQLKIESIVNIENDDYDSISNFPVLLGDRTSLRKVMAYQNIDGVVSNIQYLSFLSGRIPTPFQRFQFSDYVAEDVHNFREMGQGLLDLAREIMRLEEAVTESNKLLDLAANKKRPTQQNAQTAKSDLLAEFEKSLFQSFKKVKEESDAWRNLKQLSDAGKKSVYSKMDQDAQSLFNEVQFVTRHQIVEINDKLRKENVTPYEIAVVVKRTAVRCFESNDFEVIAPIRDNSKTGVFALRERLGLMKELSRVYYIGPIRDIDRDVSGRSIRRSLGLHGEYCASVLQRESREKISNPPVPPGLLDLDDAQRFGEVLNAWMQHLELANSVEVEDRGRHKAGIKIVPRRGGPKTVSVNSVGVGVAQVLPIVMQCLLAEPGSSITIVEQPELHLHPSIEIKLADFFIACARSGRQIFIETHSEHMINRLRLEIAGDSAGNLRELVSVLFANQDESTGITTYEDAIINEIGGIEGGWPDKFLDLSTEQSLELLGTAVRRRQADKYADFDDEDEDF